MIQLLEKLMLTPMITLSCCSVVSMTSTTIVSLPNSLKSTYKMKYTKLHLMNDKNTFEIWKIICLVIEYYIYLNTVQWRDWETFNWNLSKDFFTRPTNSLPSRQAAFTYNELTKISNSPCVIFFQKLPIQMTTWVFLPLNYSLPK